MRDKNINMNSNLQQTQVRQVTQRDVQENSNSCPSWRILIGCICVVIIVAIIGIYTVL